jgi:hypothetical protein
LYSPGGGIELILRSGEAIDVGGGDFRIISFLGVPGISGLNNRSSIAFSASFTDGSSGIFIAGTNVQVVPLPASFALLLAGLTFLGAISWRYRWPLGGAPARPW